MNKYRDLFEKYVAEVGRAPHALTRVWVLGFCDWLARNDSGLTPRALDVCPDCFDTGYRRVSPTILAKCSCKHGQRQ